MKALILAAGKGTRLGAPTLGIGPNGVGMSKPLILAFNKPTIYYQIAKLIETGHDDIHVICSPNNIEQYTTMLGNGDSLGISISYDIQRVPRGIAEAFLIARRFIGNDSVALTFGDNIFHGGDLVQKMRSGHDREMATAFALQVKNPQDYGVVTFSGDDKPVAIEEKPAAPQSNWAIPGMYFYPPSVVEVAQGIEPSSRGELEISTVNEVYLQQGHLRVEKLADLDWHDTGNPKSLLVAAKRVCEIEEATGRLVGSPEAEAFLAGFISADQLARLASGPISKSDYGKTLMSLAENERW